jgi:methyl-accepting chemotaxis protein WspA
VTARSVGDRLESILDQANVVSARIGAVHDGVRDQSSSASQISEAMAHLADGARRTAASLREFNGAAQTLHEAVASLRDGVSHFAVRE